MDAVSILALLYQMRYMLLSIAIQQVDEWYLNHSVATWSLAHCCACAAHKNLSCKRRVVDSHIELEQLVLCHSRNALAGEVHAVTHVKQVVNARNLLHMCLVIDKIWVGLDCSCNLVEVVTLLNLNINHAAVYACTYRNCH